MQRFLCQGWEGIADIPDIGVPQLSQIACGLVAAALIVVLNVSTSQAAIYGFHEVIREQNILESTVGESRQYIPGNAARHNDRTGESGSSDNARQKRDIGGKLMTRE